MSVAGEAEQVSVSVLESADLDPDVVHPWTKIVRLTLGPDAIIRAPLIRAPAALHVIDGRPRIALSNKLPREYRAFYALHELGHWALRHHGLDAHIEEQMADSVAASLLATRRAFLRLVREHGQDYRRLAAEAVQTESWAALRYAEACDVPTVLVAKRVRVRGPEWCWGDEQHVRAMARKPGIAKTRLTDDPSRIVIDGSQIELAETSTTR